MDEIPPQNMILKEQKDIRPPSISNLTCDRFRSMPYYPCFGFPAAHHKMQMQLNPRYISKITHSPRKMPESSIRMRPYYIPERSRTKSENADASTTSNSIYQESCILADAINTSLVVATHTNTFMETCDTQMLEVNPFVAGAGSSSSAVRRKVITIKRSKSLEDVRVENLAASQPSHEMEFVSSRIQKLKVHE